MSGWVIVLICFYVAFFAFLGGMVAGGMIIGRRVKKP